MNRIESRWETAALAVVLFIAGIGLYAVDLHNEFLLDDRSFIAENEYIRDLSLENVGHWFTENSYAGAGKLSEYYRPLLIASFALQYAVHDVQLFGYHLVNNILHAVNGLLVFWLLLLTLRKKWLAFFAALIFVIHPMQSEGVAFISGRGDLMSSLFMLGGLIVWVKGLQRRTYFLPVLFASLLLVCALLSRENGIVFSFLAIVVYIAFVSRESLWPSVRDAVIRTSPFLAIVAGYFALRLTVLNFRDFLNFGNYDSTSVYAQDIFVRLYTFMHVLLEYMRTFLWPTNVHERFTFPIHTSFFDLSVWTVFLVLVGILAVLIVLYRREQSGVFEKSTDVSPFRLWFFAWGWFFAALAPATGILPTNVIIQDHRLYLAMISISVLGLYYAWKSVAYVERQGFVYAKHVAIAALVVYLGFFAWITVERAIIWGKPIELFEETLRYEPESVKAHSELAVLHIDAEEYDEAEAYLRTALLNGAEDYSVFHNMGYVLQRGPKQNSEAAILFYERALAIEPSHWRSHQQLAEIFMQRGDTRAINDLEKLSSQRPKDANVMYNLAAMQNFLGNKEAALAWIIKGQQLAAQNPDDVKKFDELKLRVLSSN